MSAPLHSAPVALGKVRTIVSVLSLSALLVPASVMASVSGTLPTVVWSPIAIEVAVAPGEAGFRQVTLTVNAPVDAQLEFSPGIAGFVRVLQTRVQAAAFQGTRIQFVIQAPAGSLFGTVLGKAYLRSGTRVLAKPLALKVTVRSEGLPVDPGELGMTTLAGVDSDGDGVRDDIEHYIAQSYGTTVEANDQFRRYASIFQQTLLDQNDRSLTQSNALQRLKVFECISEALRLTAQQRPIVRGDFLARFLNTRERSLAYIDSERHLGGVEVGSETFSEPTCGLRPQ